MYFREKYWFAEEGTGEPFGNWIYQTLPKGQETEVLIRAPGLAKLWSLMTLARTSSVGYTEQGSQAYDFPIAV